MRDLGFRHLPEVATLPAASSDLKGVIALLTTDNKPYFCDGSQWVDLTGGSKKSTIWIPASAMLARVTSGAAPGVVETTTNKVIIKTLDFDAASVEYAQFFIQMPKSWDRGTVATQAVWSHPAADTNFGVVWSMQGVALADGDAADTAFGTEQTCADTGGITSDVYISPESDAITIGNTPGASELVVFQVSRAVADGGDTMAVDARLHGVRIVYSSGTGNDA